MCNTTQDSTLYFVRQNDATVSVVCLSGTWDNLTEHRLSVSCGATVSIAGGELFRAYNGIGEQVGQLQTLYSRNRCVTAAWPVLLEYATAGQRVGIRYARVQVAADLATATMVDSATYSDSLHDYIMPSCVADDSGNVYLGFDGVGPSNEYPSAYLTAKAAGWGRFAPAACVKRGTAWPGTPSNFRDYSGIALDPLAPEGSPSAAWFIGQWEGKTGSTPHMWNWIQAIALADTNGVITGRVMDDCDWSMATANDTAAAAGVALPVSLYGSQVGTVTTDASGMYRFTCPARGTYQVRNSTSIHATAGSGGASQTALGDTAITIGLSASATSSEGNNFTRRLPTLQPILEAIWPTRKPVADTSLTLEITGQNFTSCSQVLVADSARATEFVSSVHLRVALSPHDVANIGTRLVKVYAPARGYNTPTQLLTITNAAAVTGSVVHSADGSGWEDVEVALIQAGTVIRMDTTGVSGSFTFDDLTAGTYDVWMAGCGLSVESRSSGGFTVQTTTPRVIGVSLAAGEESQYNIFRCAASQLSPDGPSLVSSSSHAALAGGTSMTVQFSGTDFCDCSWAALDGQLIPTTVVSSTQLTASLPAAQLAASPGYHLLTVRNPRPATGQSESQPFAIIFDSLTVPALVRPCPGGDGDTLLVNAHVDSRVASPPGGFRIKAVRTGTISETTPMRFWDQEDTLGVSLSAAYSSTERRARVVSRQASGCGESVYNLVQGTDTIVAEGIHIRMHSPDLTAAASDAVDSADASVVGATTSPCSGPGCADFDGDGQRCASDSLLFASHLGHHRARVVTAPSGGSFQQRGAVAAAWSPGHGDLEKVWLRVRRSQSPVMGDTTMIASAIPASAGSFTWHVPGTFPAATDYKLDALFGFPSEPGALGIGRSDTTFAINACVAVTSPTSGGVLATGTCTSLTWSAPGCDTTGLRRIELYLGRASTTSIPNWPEVVDASIAGTATSRIWCPTPCTPAFGQVGLVYRFWNSDSLVSLSSVFKLVRRNPASFPLPLTAASWAAGTESLGVWNAGPNEVGATKCRLYIGTSSTSDPTSWPMLVRDTTAIGLCDTLFHWTPPESLAQGHAQFILVYYRDPGLTVVDTLFGNPFCIHSGLTSCGGGEGGGEGGGDPGCPYVDTRTDAGWELENTILGRSVSGALSGDILRLRAPASGSGGYYQLRIRENESEETALGLAKLVLLDHPVGTKAYLTPGRAFLGSKVAAVSVMKPTGEDLTARVNGSGSGYLGQPGDTLLVDLGAAGVPERLGKAEGRQANRQSALTGGDGGFFTINGAIKGKVRIVKGASPASIDGDLLASDGIKIEAPDGQGGWRTAVRDYPRENADDFLVDSLSHGHLRLIFVGTHGVRFIGRVVPQTDLSARILSPSSAKHSRLGDQLGALAGVDSAATTLVSGDTLTLGYPAPALGTGLVRDFFLVTRGVYTSVIGSLHRRRGPTLEAPVRFALGQNRPNPFSRTTAVRFDVPQASRVRIEIFDVAGRLVRRLVDGRYQPGNWLASWDRRTEDGGLASTGVYFYRMQAGSFRDQKKLMILQ
ncbi:MAG: T9SS type A sorting domain-containing protein [Candidatus Eisenbacteria bacterium]|nr:T9SS type A sorting domain-containing protein [Candidatus Eisenbacteria bacterium]